MTHEERLDSLEASRILQSNVFRRVFEKLDARYVQAWRASADSIKREDWWHKQRALAEVQAELFAEIQCAALKGDGKDKVLNAACYAAKGAINGRKS